MVEENDEGEAQAWDVRHDQPCNGTSHAHHNEAGPAPAVGDVPVPEGGVDHDIEGLHHMSISTTQQKIPLRT